MVTPFATKSFLPDLSDNEEVYLVIREHWIVLAGRLFFWFIFAAVVLLAHGAIQQYLPALAVGNAGTLLSIVRSALIIQAVLGMYLAWVMYYLNVEIITNERIIDIDQKSLLSHQTSELHLHKVEDVTTDIKGPLQNLLDFGTVYVQTAGEKERFVFPAVPHPHEVTKIILDLYEKVAPVHPEIPTAPTAAPTPQTPPQP